MDEAEFFVDVFSILPEQIECLIQAPALENATIQNRLVDTEFDYFKLLSINHDNRSELTSREVSETVVPYIQSIKIMQDSKLLFEGFDGFEFGVLSKSLALPDWFKQKYIPYTCIISEEW